MQLAAFTFFVYVFFHFFCPRPVVNHWQETVFGNVQETKVRVSASLFLQNFASVNTEPNSQMAVLVGSQKTSVETDKDQFLCWENDHRRAYMVEWW